MSKQKKILVELSGGLDSSVAAILLQNQGYEVVGCMMHLHDSPNFDNDLRVAKSVAKQLKIEFQVVDYREKFQQEVISYFIDTYKEAKTPNPCIVCNQRMKFGIVFELAKKLNCDHIATGHYARIVCEANKFELHKAKDLTKDQSYVLHFLDQEKLSKIIFPLGEYTKDEVRELAREANLPCVDKEESMDLCFAEGKTYYEYILENSDYKPEPGNVIDTKGNILGEHEGLINYTIGQRKGLGIAGGDPLYVLSLDKTKNEVILGTKDETFVDEVHVSDFTWISGKAPAENFKCQAKLRYRQVPKDCLAKVDGNSVILEYPEGIDSVTPGQFAVLYVGDRVLGGGIIN
ncbi:MAG: tRNA 2-thiouridine(34) synthase MnmA [Coriobacteriia bacterium]|nr:tRNA 2-thiouridine(34) synthase MnmA [Coriobacteriia bacterium]